MSVLGEGPTNCLGWSDDYTMPNDHPQPSPVHTWMATKLRGQHPVTPMRSYSSELPPDPIASEKCPTGTIRWRRARIQLSSRCSSAGMAETEVLPIHVNLSIRSLTRRKGRGPDGRESELRRFFNGIIASNMMPESFRRSIIAPYPGRSSY